MLFSASPASTQIITFHFLNQVFCSVLIDSGPYSLSYARNPDQSFCLSEDTRSPCLSFQELGLLHHLKILAEVSILLIHIPPTGRGFSPRPAQLLTQAFPILQPTGHLRSTELCIASHTAFLLTQTLSPSNPPPPHPAPAASWPRDPTQTTRLSESHRTVAITHENLHEGDSFISHSKKDHPDRGSGYPSNTGQEQLFPIIHNPAAPKSQYTLI